MCARSSRNMRTRSSHETHALLSHLRAPLTTRALLHDRARHARTARETGRGWGSAASSSSGDSSQRATPPPQLPPPPLPLPLPQLPPTNSIIDPTTSLAANLIRLVGSRIQRPLAPTETAAVLAALDEGLSVLQTGGTSARQQLLANNLLAALSSPLEAIERPAPSLAALASGIIESCSTTAAMLFADAAIHGVRYGRERRRIWPLHCGVPHGTGWQPEEQPTVRAENEAEWHVPSFSGVIGDATRAVDSSSSDADAMLQLVHVRRHIA
jgi:hypothetical protein